MNDEDRINKNNRIMDEALYMCINNCTVRDVAKYFKTSKSTVHRDFILKLPYINYNLYMKVKEIMKINYEMKHIRGGESTRLKYLNLNRR